MSDNPLADWLRERGAWSGDGDPDGDPDPTGPASVLDAAAPSPYGAERPAPAPPLGWMGPPPAASGTGHGDPLPIPDDWTDDPPQRPDRPRRMLLLLGLAALPWLGFTAVALGTLGGADGPADGAPEQDPGTTSVATPTAPTGAAPGGATPGSGSPDAPPPARAGERSAAADAEGRAGAAAALAVRTDVTGEVAGGGPVRYVDLAVAESVAWVGDIAIVEVAAVVLESDGEQWDEGRPARFAVPVRLTEAAAVAIATPWPLPPPAAAEAPSWEPVADTDLAEAAASALAEGGYEQIADLSLARSTDAPGVLAANVEAVAPGATDAAAHQVWLRDGDPPSLLTADHDTEEHTR